MNVLRAKMPTIGTLYIQTGEEFRKLIKGSTVTAQKSRAINEVGGLQPEFLTINLWTSVLMNAYEGNQHLVLDGTPRKLHEADILHSCFDFYDFAKPWVINIDISEEESYKRLTLRKRADDTEEDIRKRMAWYETDVVPTLSYYDANPKYTFLKIFGGRSVEDIHADIVKKIGLV